MVLSTYVGISPYLYVCIHQNHIHLEIENKYDSMVKMVHIGTLILVVWIYSVCQLPIQFKKLCYFKQE